jgi:hypothetical protein
MRLTAAPGAGEVDERCSTYEVVGK